MCDGYYWQKWYLNKNICIIFCSDIVIGFRSIINIILLLYCVVLLEVYFSWSYICLSKKEMFLKYYYLLPQIMYLILMVYYVLYIVSKQILVASRNKYNGSLVLFDILIMAIITHSG